MAADIENQIRAHLGSLTGDLGKILGGDFIRLNLQHDLVDTMLDVRDRAERFDTEVLEHELVCARATRQRVVA